MDERHARTRSEATRRAKDAQASLEAANAALAAKDAALGVMEARAAAVVAELERLRVSEADALEAAAAEQVNHQISFVETRQEIVQNPDKKKRSRHLRVTDRLT